MDPAPCREEGSGVSDIASSDSGFHEDWGSSARSIGQSDMQHKEAPGLRLAPQLRQEHVLDINRTPPRPGKEHFRRHFSLFYPFTKADASPPHEGAASAPPQGNASDDATEEHVARTEGGGSHSVVFTPEHDPIFTTKSDLSPAQHLPERAFFPPLPPLSSQRSRDTNRAAVYSPSFRSLRSETSRDVDPVLQGRQGSLGRAGAAAGAGSSCDFSQTGTGLSKELFGDMEEGQIQEISKDDGRGEILYKLRDSPPIGECHLSL